MVLKYESYPKRSIDFFKFFILLLGNLNIILLIDTCIIKFIYTYKLWLIIKWIVWRYKFYTWSFLF